MTSIRATNIGMLLAYFTFIALFSTSFFVQELLNGNMAGQFLIAE